MRPLPCTASLIDGRPAGQSVSFERTIGMAFLSPIIALKSRSKLNLAPRSYNVIVTLAWLDKGIDVCAAEISCYSNKDIRAVRSLQEGGREGLTVASRTFPVSLSLCLSAFSSFFEACGRSAGSSSV